MADNSKIIPILRFEEGYSEKPYIDTEGYPTVAVGVRIGPKGAALSNYSFKVPPAVSDVWLNELVNAKIKDMLSRPTIAAALKVCNSARCDVLYSMGYQLGVDGLVNFKNTLSAIAAGNFAAGADGMLNSLWARQTPKRANRLAAVMRTGTYDAYTGLI